MNGKHYKTLVDIVKNIPDGDLMKDDAPAKEYLTKLLEKTTCIEYPFSNEETQIVYSIPGYIKSISEKLTKTDYSFFNDRILGLESDNVAIIMDKKPDSINIVSCRNGEGIMMLIVGTVVNIEYFPEERRIRILGGRLYDYVQEGNRRFAHPRQQETIILMGNVVNFSAAKFIEQSAYLELQKNIRI
jgi:hypothetical protein